MIITNKGNKVVGIAGKILLPGTSDKFAARYAETPAVKTLCKMGYLEISEEKAAKPAPEKKGEAKAPEVNEEAKAPESKPKTASKSTRKPKAAK